MSILYSGIGGGGGGGGTTNYNALSNKPQINGVTLQGNKTSAQLGIRANYTLTELSITSTGVALKDILDAIHSKNLPSGSYVVGGVILTDFPDDRLINAEIQVSVKDSSISGVQVYDVILSSLDVEPYIWYAGYRTDSSTSNVTWVNVIDKYTSMPSASALHEGRIVQFEGTTTSTYTNGYFYKCVSNGQTPATYSWTQINVQPAGGGTYTAGIGIDITNNVISNTGLINTATGTNALTILGTATTVEGAINIGKNSVASSIQDVAIGYNAQANGGQEEAVAIGYSTQATGPKSTALGSGAHSYGNASIALGKSAEVSNASTYGIAIGFGAQATANRAIQLGRQGSDNAVNSDAETFKVANINGNFELMSADGTIPEARLANTASATTGQILALNASGNAEWADNTEIINTVASTSTTAALSANMGKELQDQITHLKGIGRFLSLWNAATGLAQTNPTVSPYDYKTGDYFIVGTVAAAGSTNYRPSGSQYVIGTASTTPETESIDIGYTYYFDGTSWNLQAGGGGTVTDVQINGTTILDASGVANIPHASVSNSGVIKTGASFNTNVLSSGYMQAVVNTYSQYQDKGNDAFIGKGTLENVLDNESVRFDTATSLTTTQQAQARSNIGAGTQTTITYWD